MNNKCEYVGSKNLYIPLVMKNISSVSLLYIVGSQILVVILIDLRVMNIIIKRMSYKVF